MFQQTLERGHVERIATGEGRENGRYDAAERTGKSHHDSNWRRRRSTSLPTVKKIAISSSKDAATSAIEAIEIA